MVDHATLRSDEADEPLMIASCDVAGNLDNDAAFIAAAVRTKPDPRNRRLRRMSDLKPEAAPRAVEDVRSDLCYLPTKVKPDGAPLWEVLWRPECIAPLLLEAEAIINADRQHIATTLEPLIAVGVPYRSGREVV
jgi:hypothetical protein